MTSSVAAVLIACLMITAADTPDAAELVREVRTAEQWLHDIDSFELRMEAFWTRSVEAIERSRTELQRQFSDVEITPKRFWNLRPRVDEVIEIAFDDHRARKLIDRKDASYDLRVWDGQKTICHERYFTHDQEHYAFASNPTFGLGSTFMYESSWPRAGRHSFWWWPLRHDELESLHPRPDQFELIGREAFDGTDCYVLEGDAAVSTRWYVGVADHRLYGNASLITPRWADVNSVLQGLGKHYGERFNEPEAFHAWFVQQAPSRQQEALALRSKLSRPLQVVRTIHRTWDWREVAPGCWFPMRQGYSHYDHSTNGQSYESSRREFTAKLLRVNQPLPDEMFEVDLREGVRVFDYRYDPVLDYRYKREMSVEEWEAIRATARQRSKQQQERSQRPTR